MLTGSLPATPLLILNNMFHTFCINKIITESTTIKSFYLKPKNGKKLSTYLPGQFISLKLILKNGEIITRNYTLSDKSNNDYYRLTIKRETEGKASKHFHDNLIEGSEIEVSKPMGDFYLDINSNKSIVLISGGVGITPMMSMLEYIVTYQPNRNVQFIHSSSNKNVEPFTNRLKRLIKKHINLNVTIFHTNPIASEKVGVDYDFKGFVTKEILAATIKEKNDYFICGPIGFMETIYNFLIELNVSEKNIFYEFFSDKKSLGRTVSFIDLKNTDIKVLFSKSSLQVNWDTEAMSLLDLAEANGLKPPSSCRMGTCFTCESKLLTGTVAYDPEPFIEAGEGKIFICCSKPTSNVTIEV